MARIRKYNQTFKSNPIKLWIQCIIQSHGRQHVYLLTLLILDIQVLKEKRKAGPIDCHASNACSSSSSNKIKFKFFPAEISLKCSSFNRVIKLTWYFKSVDRQNRSMMPLSCWHFDDGWVWRGYVWLYGKQNDQCLTSCRFLSAVYHSKWINFH